MNCANKAEMGVKYETKAYVRFKQIPFFLKE